jgi:hypothetical protein
MPVPVTFIDPDNQVITTIDDVPIPVQGTRIRIDRNEYHVLMVVIDYRSSSPERAAASAQVTVKPVHAGS